MEFNSNITFLLFFLLTFFISVFSAGRVNRTLASCPQNTNTTIMQYPHLKFGAGSESLTRTFDLASRRSVVELYPHGAGEANRTPIASLEDWNSNL